ncbi:MAG: histidinol-phosphate aminotransferase family protein [Nitrosopumilus sp. H13]|nr:MAG: histidinol-phosphate aminotransferase family protein [Nitrosopumilus sp. H13]
MRKGWFEQSTRRLATVRGYQKPELNSGALKLDSNENYVIPKQFQGDILTHARRNSDVREYPLGGAERLIRAISKFVRMPPSMIGVGNGSDQILDMILGSFASKKTRVLTSDPTFGFFERRCGLYSIPMITVPFSEQMELDAKDFESKFSKADILYLDSPNNPTGFQFKKKDLQGLVRSFGGLVIIDEAYGEFGDYGLSSMTKTHKNLVVVRTLSKSFGLAGLRLGYFVANPQFTDVFMRVLQYPYPLSTIAIESGIAALERLDAVKTAVAATKSERERIIRTLGTYDSFDVFDSKANFVLFDAHGAYRRIHSALAEQGISVRKLGRIGSHGGCLRVSVGTKEMNSKFLLAVRDLLG